MNPNNNLTKINQLKPVFNYKIFSINCFDFYLKQKLFTIRLLKFLNYTTCKCIIIQISRFLSKMNSFVLEIPVPLLLQFYLLLPLQPLEIWSFLLFAL